VNLSMPTKANQMMRNWEEHVPEFYRIIARDACDNRQKLFIQNDSIAHGVFLTSLLIKNANHSLKIFSGSIDELFYCTDPVEAALQDAYNRGVKIDIICAREDMPKNNLRKLWNDDNVQKINRISISKLTDFSIYKSHFLVSDDNAFRLEEFHTQTQFEDGYLHATVNFNDAQLGEFLLKKFALLEKASVPISIK
jgi:hypothetical protein